MKKKTLSLVLTLFMVLSLIAPPALADNEGVVVDALHTNLIKVTTTEDFENGSTQGLAIVDVGNGAVRLSTGATEGTFTSAIYNVSDFSNMVASWSASTGAEGGSVEVLARANVSKDGGETYAWSNWFSWGEYGPTIPRGCADSSGVDEFNPNGDVTQVQFMGVLRRAYADDASPVLRQITASIKGGDAVPAYAETPVDELPEYVLTTAPAYSQLIRDPDIGGSICSPSTITVMLNARDPQLDLLPEELALSVRDFNYGFGNWAFSASAAGLYGYEAYVQYASKDILLQELANGRSVGLSVRYSAVENGSYPYLEGAYSNTGGHLITIIGYEYEDGRMDDDHLYFYSSDTYARGDSSAFRRYKWTQLDKCWSNRVGYFVSLEAEAGAEVTGVERVAAQLEAVEGATVFALTAAGRPIDLTNFTAGKTSTLGRGVLAYTVEGFATTAAEELDRSVLYEKRLQVTANDTFFYTDIAPTAEGNLAINFNRVLADLGVAEGETRKVTVYAIANNGRMYVASIDVTVDADQIIAIAADNAPKDYVIKNAFEGGVVRGEAFASGVEGALFEGVMKYWLPVGIVIPDDANLKEAKYYVGTQPFDGAYTGAGLVRDGAFSGCTVLKLDAEKEKYYINIDWANGQTAMSYLVDFGQVILGTDAVAATGNLIHVDLSSGRYLGGATLNEDGHVTLNEGSGVYVSPVYESAWPWEYLMGTVNAVTPGTSSVELQIRAVAERAQGAWSDWFTWGVFGSGVESSSSGRMDDYLNLDTDVFVVRGSSATANVSKMQFRVVLNSDENGNVPTVFGVNATYKKSAYSKTEGVYTGETAVDDLPESAFVPVTATSAYSYASGMSAWRFENMMLMMLNSQGSDLLFEEVALDGYDFNSGWGNWAYTIHKAGLFGHEAYTQYGATPALIQQTLADGKIVGLYIHGGRIPTTNSSNSRQIVVYGYETVENDVAFRYICVSGDKGELSKGQVYGSCTAAQLSEAIGACGSTNVRGAMYVVGKRVVESGVKRVPVSSRLAEGKTVNLYLDGTSLLLPKDFVSGKTAASGNGVIAYTLNSEADPSKKLAEHTLYYDITVNGDGSLALPSKLQQKIADGDKANLYIICNNGVTYTTTIVKPRVIIWEDETEVPAPTEEVVNPQDPTSGLFGFSAFINGFTDNTFRGQERITREQFVKILYELNVSADAPFEAPQKATFSDVAAPDASTGEGGHWSYAAIEWAYSKGLVKPDEEGAFRPADVLLRGEMAAMLSAMEGLEEKAENSFTDVDGHQYEEDVLKAAKAGLFKGYPDGTFKPDQGITRYETVVALVRYLLGGNDPTDEQAKDLAVPFADVSPYDDWYFKHLLLATNGYLPTDLGEE